MEIYVVRQVEVGSVWGVYSSLEKAQAAAARYNHDMPLTWSFFDGTEEYEDHQLGWWIADLTTWKMPSQVEVVAFNLDEMATQAA